MTILFVENRYKTDFWAAIATELVKDGHQIHWIVQNHTFRPTMGTVHILPYFRQQPIQKNDAAPIKRVIAAHRGINYFGATDDHIFYYQQQISDCLAAVQPDLVIGECTLMHELLTIEICRERDILFLHPTSCRYPVGRFAFYKYDSLEAFGGSGEVLSEEKAIFTATQIAEGKSKPVYMQKPQPLSRKEKLQDKWRLITGYYGGERFNTPPILRKMQLDRNSATQVKALENIAIREIIATDDFKILFPLHMQPEANVDVWGRPFNDQIAVIKNTAAQLREGEYLYVKPNPKSKYELTAELLNTVQQLPNVRIFHPSVKMDAVIGQMQLLITISGTAAMECILADKPVVVLSPQYYAALGGGANLTDWAQLQGFITQIKNKTFPLLTASAKAQVINNWNKTSFAGNIGDGLHSRSFLHDAANMQGIIAAFRKIIQQITSKSI
jgi:hypothetical protein